MRTSRTSAQAFTRQDKQKCNIVPLEHLRNSRARACFIVLSAHVALVLFLPSAVYELRRQHRGNRFLCGVRGIPLRHMHRGSSAGQVH